MGRRLQFLFSLLIGVTIVSFGGSDTVFARSGGGHGGSGHGGGGSHGGGYSGGGHSFRRLRGRQRQPFVQRFPDAFAGQVSLEWGSQPRDVRWSFDRNQCRSVASYSGVEQLGPRWRAWPLWILRILPRLVWRVWLAVLCLRVRTLLWLW